MAEFILLLALGLAYAMGWILWQLAKLLWQFLVWVTEPIRDEIALEELRREEMQKREQILAAHREARLHIDSAAASSLRRFTAAANRVDGAPRRRQSG